MNPKRARFVAEYLKDLNATQAAMRAGYRARTARQQGARLLTKADIQQAVQASQHKRLEKLEITSDRVLAEVARIGFSDIRAWFDDKGNLRPVHELSADVAAALGSVEVHREKTRSSDGNEQTVTIEECLVKVKAWDKMRALELLAKHLGIVKEQHEHTGKDGRPIETRVVFGGRYRPAGADASG